MSQQTPAPSVDESNESDVEATVGRNAAGSRGRRRLRWLQVRMVTILLAISLCCAGLGIRQAHVNPYMRQTRARTALVKLRADLQLEPGRPSWIRFVVGKKRHQDVVEIRAKGLQLPTRVYRSLEDLPRLRNLYLERSNVDNETLRHIADLRELERLSLWQTLISSDGMKHLEQLTNLQVLDIHNTAVDNDGLQYLRNLTSLRLLKLSSGISDEGLKWLRGLYNLRELDVTSSKVTIAGFRHLARCSRLRRLAFSHDATKSGFAGLRHVPNLEVLLIPGAGFGDEDFQHLRGFRKLKTLVLTDHRVSDKGIRQLVESCPALEEIHLMQSLVSDEGLKLLAALPKLRRVFVGSPLITPDGIEELIKTKRDAVKVSSPWLSPADRRRLKSLSKVQQLNLRSTAVFRTIPDDSGSQSIALDLSRSRATAASLVHLHRFPRLYKLTISGQRLRFIEHEHLAPLRSLVELEVKQGRLSVSGLREVAQLKQLKVLKVRLHRPLPEEIEALSKMTHLDLLIVTCWRGMATLLTPVVEKLSGKTKVVVRAVD